MGSRRSSARSKNLEGTVRGTTVETAQGREEEEGEDSDVVEIVLMQCQFCAVRLEQEGLMRHMAFVHFKARWVSPVTGWFSLIPSPKFFHPGSEFFPSRQCCGSMTFWGGSGSADPCLLLMDRIRILDPDSAIFVIDLRDASKKLIF